jgi:serine/threonine protein kinase
MGVVYRARHVNDAVAARQGGVIALKVLHQQYATNPFFQKHFEAEATLVLKLNHPGVVLVHDLVMDHGQLALAMELVQGRSLATILSEERGLLPWVEALTLFDQLLDAVGYAHSHGVIHRDLKPENVMVDPQGRLKVLDFGIACEVQADSEQPGTVMGTVDYMAPEQYTAASTVDERADVYALGMTLYEMLTGQLPWARDTTEFAVMKAKVEDEIVDPRELYPDIPEDLVEVLMGALAADRTERFRSVHHFREALTTVEGGPLRSLHVKDDEAPLAKRSSGCFLLGVAVLAVAMEGLRWG